jgi:muramoyltetrapeptide carboxypeptidase
MRIAVVAPSGPPTQARVAAGVQLLQDAGHDVAIYGAIAAPTPISYLNDDDNERSDALLSALHSQVDVVWCARGGYGLHRLLSRLLGSMNEQLPLMIGFSDMTALFGAASKRGLLHRCIHGPLVTTLADEPDDSQARVWSVLDGIADPLSVQGLGTWSVEGTLFAGNLTVLAALVGTPSMPVLTDHVLVIEDVGEAPYRIDRMMTQLMLSNALVGVRAIVVGQLTKCDLATGTPALQVVQERARAAGIPVAWGISVGHESPNSALPLGVPVRVRVVDGAGSLSWL